MERVKSAESSSNREKRRSGFFGLGGKKKDKDDKDKLIEERQRPSSFSVDRPLTLSKIRQLDQFSSQTRLSQQRSPFFPAVEAQALERPEQSSKPTPAIQGQNTARPSQRPSTLETSRRVKEFDQQQPRSIDMGSNLLQKSRGQQQGYRAGAEQGIGQSSQQLQKQTPHTASALDQPPAPSITPARGRGSPHQGSFFDGAGSTNPSSASGPGNHDIVDMDRFMPIMELIAVQPQKVYVTSPPELEMILARTSAGGQPKQGQPGSPSNDWDPVWLQLSGISLSMWSMKETRAAAAKGEKVPPTYFNITDSSLELLAPLPPPPHRPNSHPHHFVYSLNTAGSNRLLFSCPTERDLARWTTGLRLAAWERARLEEIYTGHLIQAVGREPFVEVGKGRSRLEGWVRVRVMGGMDWRRLWVVLSTPGDDTKEETKKHRRRSFFGMGGKEEEKPPQEPSTGMPMASFYAEQRTGKNKSSTTPVLTMTNVSQAYAVFPEQLGVISSSNLFKVVGHITGEIVTIETRLRDSGWALLMPEHPGDNPYGSTESASLSNRGQGFGAPLQNHSTSLTNVMRWLTGFHDAFKLYGRPEKYDWDLRNPKSLFFAYPQGHNRLNLFLDIEEALDGDFRVTTLSDVRSQFISLVHRRMSQIQNTTGDNNIEEVSKVSEDDQPLRHNANYRVPPFSFGDTPNNQQNLPRSLTPITERTDITRQNSTKTAKSAYFIAGKGAPSTDATAGDRKFSGESSTQGSWLSRLEEQGGSKLLPVMYNSLRSFSSLDEHLDKAYSNFSSKTDTAINPPSASNPQPGGSGANTQTRTASPSIQSKTSGSIYSQDTIPTPGGATSNYNHNVRPSPLVQHEPALDKGVAQNGAIANKNQLAPNILQSNGLSIQTGTSLKTGSSLTVPAGSPVSHSIQLFSPVPRKVSSGDPLPEGVELGEEPAALYLMNMVEEPSALPDPISFKANASSPTNPMMGHNSQKEREISSQPQQTSRNGLGRKPSGARALPIRNNTGLTMETIQDEKSSEEPVLDALTQRSPTPTQAQGEKNLNSQMSHPELGEDISSYIAYAENPSPVKTTTPPFNSPKKPTSPKEEVVRSSFAPSRAALERRAKIEQARKEQRLPGGGKKVMTNSSVIPGFSSDEESDEEEEEESEDEQTLFEKRALPVSSSEQPEQSEGQQRQASSTTASRALPPVPRIKQPEEYVSSEYGDELRLKESQHIMDNKQGHSSPFESRTSQFMGTPRTVSQLSRTPSPANGGLRARPISTMTTVTLNPNPNGGSYPGPGLRQRPSTQFAQAAPPDVRQTVWNANFSAEHGMEENKGGKFVEVEEPSAQLTKAFAPHGLLQAGIQDKEERSAKKQEELARETGSSLINVPAKPPPPKTGLLGAVAAHERDRKNAGGIGATLTDREREKRLAEERQREIERLQRQQAESGVYPQQGFGGYQMAPNLMMNMPMMGMGYPYQAGFNPFAQQQAMMAAQMAYSQTMVAMSQAGSQAGDYPEPVQPSPSQIRSRRPSGTDERSTSSTGSFNGPHPFSPIGMSSYPSFYGYPQGMGMGGMGSPMPMSPAPWMMPQTGAWGMPNPLGQGSPMDPTFSLMPSPGNMMSDTGSFRAKSNTRLKPNAENSGQRVS
ncbi:uncharacterized protein L203_104833 [Cryptococcus depauperatus CBS 7841]|uniref:CCR4-NOT transcriptional complex subunit CAF120 n=1 Tax=Cryptococcus depauperatus CBS 7841 TaxID=1295531 RepID=A0A1E3IN56_9TREE|nr:hypothetical protein L203_01960 [Cryptococcus depauperatus CBS 7841]